VAKRLFVGNLAYSTTNEQLAEYFSQFGEVSSATVIMDRESGRSKGYGFVEFADDAAGDSAVSKGDGAEYEGRRLTVSEAKPRVAN
jgi:RNA recognition motif-containing protein